MLLGLGGERFVSLFLFRQLSVPSNEQAYRKVELFRPGPRSIQMCFGIKWQHVHGVPEIFTTAMWTTVVLLFFHTSHLNCLTPSKRCAGCKHFAIHDHTKNIVLLATPVFAILQFFVFLIFYPNPISSLRLRDSMQITAAPEHKGCHFSIFLSIYLVDCVRLYSWNRVLGIHIVN